MIVTLKRETTIDDFKEEGFEELFWTWDAMTANICSMAKNFKYNVIDTRGESLEDLSFDVTIIRYAVGLAKIITIDSGLKKITLGR